MRRKTKYREFEKGLTSAKAENINARIQRFIINNYGTRNIDFSSIVYRFISVQHLKKRFNRSFTKLLLNPPAWSDTYYGRKKKQEQPDQIVDVPHFVDSKEVALIQLADF
jgi:hypothetical protein